MSVRPTRSLEMLLYRFHWDIELAIKHAAQIREKCRKRDCKNCMARKYHLADY